MAKLLRLGKKRNGFLCFALDFSITPNSSGGKLHYVIVFMKKISKLEGIMSTTP